MKKVMLVLLMLSLIICSVTFAQNQDQDQDIKSTIVGPVMDNRYVAPTPQDQNIAQQPTVVKLMDQGVIPAAEQARLEQQALSTQNQTGR